MIREIICNTKCRNKEWEKSVEDTINVQKRFKEKLQTKTAKEMLEKDFEIIENFWQSYKKLHQSYITDEVFSYTWVRIRLLW